MRVRHVYLCNDYNVRSYIFMGKEMPPYILYLSYKILIRPRHMINRAQKL